MWAAQFYKNDESFKWLSSGGAGTMGFGFPAAIGAQLGCPNDIVVSISGDGGFQMTLFELATAAILKLPIKIIVLNNHYLGMVRQWQELFFDNRESGVDLIGNPDFVKLAEAYGIKASTSAAPPMWSASSSRRSNTTTVPASLKPSASRPKTCSP
nr:thiamine pyrophosphate-dependent enzyme [Verrucomicrobium spinosum]